MKKKLSLVFIIELIFFVFLFVSCPSSADDEYIKTTFYSEDGAFYFTLNEEGTGWNATHMESDTKLSDDYAIPTTFRNLPVSYLAVYDNSISKITIPAGIEDFIIEGDHITEVVISSGVEHIGTLLCPKVETINIPSSVKTIETFSGCIGLKSIVLPETLESLGSNIFNGCSLLTELVIPANVNCSEGLLNGSSIKKVTFSEGIESIAVRLPESIEEVVLPSSLKKIENYQFANCTNLKSVNIPEGVIEIGEDAFFNTGITAIEIPSTVMKLGVSSFANNKNLSSVVLNEGLVEIGERAFEYCSSLSSLALPESLESIGYRAFALTALTSLTLSGNLSSVNSYILAGCNSLNTIYVPFKEEELNWIGWDYDIPESCNVFYNNTTDDFSYIISKDRNSYILTGLPTSTTQTDVVVPETYNGLPISKIGNSAFKECSSITSITIPKSITVIGDSAFAGCTGLTEFVIPSNWTEIGNSVFKDCTSLTSVTFEDGSHLKTCGINLFSGCETLINVDYGNNDNPNLFSEGSFRNCTTLEEITLPAGTTEIPDNAFNGCSSLSSVVLQDGDVLTSVGDSAFFSCSSIKDLSFLEGVESIGPWAFNYCTGLTNINIPDSVRSIGERAFLECRNVTEISIPSSVETIGEYAFTIYLNKVEKINVGYVRTTPESWHFSFENAFPKAEIISTAKPNKVYYNISRDMDSYYVDGLLPESTITEIVIEEKINGLPVIKVGENAFASCNSIESVSIPDSVEILESSAFENCSSLKSIKLSNNITEIPDYTFRDCTSLASIEMPDSVTTIGSDVFDGCVALSDVKLSENLEVIAGFSGCSSLSNIEIPESVYKIQAYAFEDCSSLSSITIPESVEYMGSGAFDGCSSLREIYLPFAENERPYGWASNWDVGIASSCTFHYSAPAVDPDNPGGEQDEGTLRYIINTYSTALDALMLDIQLGNKPNGVTTDPSNILTAQEYTVTMQDVYYENADMQFVFNGTYEYSLDVSSYTQTEKINLTEGSSIDGVKHTAKWNLETSMSGSSTTDAVVDSVELPDQSVNL